MRWSYRPPVSGRVKPSRRTPAEEKGGQRALVVAVAQGVVPVAREPERGADREDEDRVRLARQRKHGQGSQGEDETANAQQHAAEEPGEKETNHGANGEEGHAATASSVSATSTWGRSPRTRSRRAFAQPRSV